jgi:hypothetical protein
VLFAAPLPVAAEYVDYLLLYPGCGEFTRGNMCEQRDLVTPKRRHVALDYGSHFSALYAGTDNSLYKIFLEREEQQKWYNCGNY